MRNSVCSTELRGIENVRGDIMSEEREKVRCQSCELVQWSDRANCRRCGSALPEPVVTVVERVVQRVVIRHDPECLENLEKARRLILAAKERLLQPVESVAPVALPQGPQTEVFPTSAEVERAAIVAAYRGQIANLSKPPGCSESGRRRFTVSSERSAKGWTCSEGHTRSWLRVPGSPKRTLSSLLRSNK